jgi:hypothetical protein
MDVVDTRRHRGEFFTVLQQTERTQTAVMTIAPGADGGPEERHGGDQVVYVVEGEAVVRIGGARASRGRGRAGDDPGGGASPRAQSRAHAALLRDRVRAARVLTRPLGGLPTRRVDTSSRLPDGLPVSMDRPWVRTPR